MVSLLDIKQKIIIRQLKPGYYKLVHSVNCNTTKIIITLDRSSALTYWRCGIGDFVLDYNIQWSFLDRTRGIHITQQFTEVKLLLIRKRSHLDGSCDSATCNILICKSILFCSYKVLQHKCYSYMQAWERNFGWEGISYTFVMSSAQYCAPAGCPTPLLKTLIGCCAAWRVAAL